MLKQVDHLRLEVGDQPGQNGETSVLKTQKSARHGDVCLQSQIPQKSENHLSLEAEVAVSQDYLTVPGQVSEPQYQEVVNT